MAHTSRHMQQPTKRPRADDAETISLNDAELTRLIDRLALLKQPCGAEAASLLKKAAAPAAAAAAPPTKHGAAEELLDMAWRELHTGHWAAVDAAWRAAYMAAALLAARASWHRCGEASSCLRTIDLGLMLGDTTFRKSLLEAADFYERQHALHKTPLASTAADATADATADDSADDSAAASSSVSPPLRALSGTLPPPPLLRLPSLAFFFNEHMVPSRPAVLTGVIDGWPACSTRPWSNLEYLKSVAGHRTVPVEHGAHYLDAAFEERLMTLAEYVDTHVRAPPQPAGGGSRAYLAQHQLFEQCPKLMRDIVRPDYCVLSLEEEEEDDDEEEGGGGGDIGGGGDGEGEGGGGDASETTRRAGGRAAETIDDVRVNAWFGPAGTLSPLHFDRYHNLLAQVVGSKYIRLYAPEHSEKLYPRKSGPHVVSSQIVEPDADDVRERFPRFADAPYVDLVLRAGECLYIPPRWWHLVEAREVSFSVSFWWM